MLLDFKFAIRSISRAKGLFVTVVFTLALGIGANAAIFSVLRGVLLRPLVNRNEDRLVYVRQSAPGNGTENATFSVPEIQDLRSRARTLTSIGEFSTITFTMIGLGEPRQVRAGVVSGNYFDVMGLRPVLGRLLNESDDGPSAPGAVVLTHRFWATGAQADPGVVGKTIRLGARSATIVGVVEPSVPYPSTTELIANMVTSPHHLSATMVTGREHRMTEVFGRLAPGADLEAARAELRVIHGAILKEHPEAYSPKAGFSINAVRLRDQITAQARPILLVLFAASALIFVIACSNVANLILARTVRREAELSTRAAVGASTARLRRTLLAESLLLCGTGAVLGVVVARPMVSVVARYAARFSVRALEVELDAGLMWMGVVLALAAAVLLAFVPRLPAGDAAPAAASQGGARLTRATNTRLRVFATIQIAASFVLLAGSGMLLVTLRALQAAQPGFDTAAVLAVDVPVASLGRTPEQVRGFYREVQRRLASEPGVDRVAFGSTVPWRDTRGGGNTLAFSVEGLKRENGNDDPRARFRSATPGFFAVLGIPFLAGRDFTAEDRSDAERVVIISANIARRLFPNQDPINRHLTWTDGLIRFIGVSPEPRRIVGVVADVDDERIEPAPVMTVYHPFEQEIGGGRLFVRAHVDPYGLVPIVTRTVRALAADQPVERASTLADVRAEMLAPERLTTLVFGGFAAVAVAIALVGVAGVLAFSVSGRTREFGIRMAVGSPRHRILAGVVREGAAIAAFGVAAGALGGFGIARLAGSILQNVRLPGPLPVIASAFLLLAAALAASVVPAARAARVDVMKALRAE